MNAEWEALFQSGDDFKLVDALFCKAAEKEERNGPASLNEAQRTLLLVWHSHGIIGNGSLRYFFECDLPVEATAKAYEIAGLSQAARLLRLAPDLFPDGKPDPDHEKRLAQLNGMDAEDPSSLDELSTVFLAACDELDSAMANFVRANKDAFKEPTI